MHTYSFTSSLSKAFFSVAALLAISLSCVATETCAQTLETLSPTQSTTGDRLGHSASVSGRRLVMGAPLSDTPLLNAGAVYAYYIDSFSSRFDGRLLPSDPSTGSNFGAAVSVSGDFVAIGAPLEDRGISVDVGSVYVFKRLPQGWVQQAKVLAPTPAAGQRFGFSVALVGNDLLVGAPGEASQRGSIYRFKSVVGTWTYQERWDPSNPILAQNFGHALAFDGTWAAVGMLQNAPEASNPGRVHMYLNMGGTFSEAQVILPTGGHLDDRAGSSLALSSNLLVVGARGLNSGAVNNGGAFVFQLQTGIWTQAQILTPGTTQANQFAGFSVAALGGFTPGTEISLGAPYFNGAASDTGAVYAFYRVGNSFIQTAVVRGSAEEAGDLFGSALGLTKIKAMTRALYGAPGDNARGADSGLGYLTRAIPRYVEAARLVCPLPDDC